MSLHKNGHYNMDSNDFSDPMFRDRLSNSF